MIEVRSSDTEEELNLAKWSKRYSSCESFKAEDFGKLLQYRLILTATSGCRTPRVKTVRVHFE